jgi:multidrug resistance protein MdtO
MFFSRTSPLGLVAFSIGFLVTISLTLIDFLPHTPPVPTAQLLTKSVLWLWGIIMLPVSIVIFGNILTGRDPTDLFDQGLIGRLEAAGRVLMASNDNLNDREKVVAYAQEGTDELLHYLKMGGIFKKEDLQRESSDRVVVAYVGRLMTLVKEWMEMKSSTPELVFAASECGTLLMSIAQSLKEKKREVVSVFTKLAISPHVENSDRERKEALLLATILEIVEELPRILAKPPEYSRKREKALHQLLVPDAFSNPDYVHYALKTTLAIFIAYITYNMLDWPGIRTCLITCFFVALGTLDETVQKMTLRLAGAIIGGALGLGTIIFIMPYLTTITGLSLVIAMVTFCAAWVATSSERLSYAGLQIALAFFLCLLVGYSPQIELTPARDRVVGVLLGNLIIFFIFFFIWPTRAIDRAKDSLARALDILSQIFSRGPVAVDEEQNALFLAFNSAISQARRYANLDPLELFNKQGKTQRIDKSWIEAVQALSGPSILLVEHPCSPLKSALAKTGLLDSVNTSLSQLAAQIKEHKLPKMDFSLIHDLEMAPTDAATHAWLLAYADWYRILDKRLSEATYQSHLPLIQDLRESRETL